MPGHDEQVERYEKQVHELQTQVKFLEEEVGLLRRRLTNAPRQVTLLEDKLVETRDQLTRAMGQNQKLADALRGERERIEALAEEVEKLSQPPATFGVYLGTNDDGSIDVFTGGRKMRVTPAPDLDLKKFRPGSQVILNESLNVVEVLDPDRAGEVVKVKDRLGEDRVVVGRGDEEAVATLAGSLLTRSLRAGDSCCSTRAPACPGAAPEGRGRRARPRGDPRRHLRGHRRPRGPDRSDPRRRRAAVPVRRAVPRAQAGAAEGRAALRASRVRQDADREGGRQVPGREGGGADRPRRPRSYFLNIKGPELLNKYVGETERQIREMFKRAKERARRAPGHRVLRRDGLAVPHAGHGHLLRRGVDHRPAAAVGDRRGGDPQERDRDRRLQSRGPDRPGDPAARPARREDQDQATRRARPREILAKYLTPSCRSTRTRSPATAATRELASDA